MPTYYDRIYTEAASCNTTGNITWTAAATQFALPPAAVDTTVEYTILDSGGSKWETGRAALSESGGTYTITRGGSQTVLAGSNGTSAESFTNSSTHKLFISPAAATLNAFPIANVDLDGGTDIGEALADADLFLVDNGANGTNRKATAARVKTYVRPPNFIDGIVPSWTDINTVAWSAGTAMVEGVLVSYAGGNTGNMTSGTSDGLSSAGVWCHWLDSSGTISLAKEASGAPTWDTTYLYWNKGGDSTYRLIGWHTAWDNSGTITVGRFKSFGRGNQIEIEMPYLDAAQSRIQSTVPTTEAAFQATASAVTVNVPSAARRVQVAAKIRQNATTGDGALNIRVSAWDLDGTEIGGSGAEISARSDGIPANGWVFFPPGFIQLAPGDNSLYCTYASDNDPPAGFLIDIFGGVLIR